MVVEFEWDEANQEHCKRHGLAPEEIETVFRGRPQIAPDFKHAKIESRFVAVGEQRKVEQL